VILGHKQHITENPTPTKPWVCQLVKNYQTGGFRRRSFTSLDWHCLEIIQNVLTIGHWWKMFPGYFDVEILLKLQDGIQHWTRYFVPKEALPEELWLLWGKAPRREVISYCPRKTRLDHSSYNEVLSYRRLSFVKPNTIGRLPDNTLDHSFFDFSGLVLTSSVQQKVMYCLGEQAKLRQASRKQDDRGLQVDCALGSTSCIWWICCCTLTKSRASIFFIDADFWYQGSIVETLTSMSMLNPKKYNISSARWPVRPSGKKK